VIRINLAPPEARRHRASFNFANFTLPALDLGVMFAIVYIVALGGIATYWWHLSSEESRTITEISRLTAELQSLKTILGNGANVKGQLADVKRRVEILEELTRGQGRSIALLDAFADTVPQDLWITSLEQRESLLKLSGTAFSTTAVSDFMSNLKASGKFKDVDIVVSRQAIDKTPSLVTFEVTCKFEI
jgi:type IV pilus assembly protein PilN